MHSFTKGLLGVALVLLLLAPVLSQASSLTSDQINSVIGLLQAFGVDAKTIDTVRIGLNKSSGPGTLTVVKTATTTAATKQPTQISTVPITRTATTTITLIQPAVKNNTVAVTRPATTTVQVIQPVTLTTTTSTRSLTTTTAPKKPVYDATQFKNKPDLLKYGLKPINVIYEWRFFASKDDIAVPLAPTLEQIGREAASKGLLTVVDIERWKMWDSAGITENVPKYVATLQGVKKAAPGVRMGYYSAAPQNNYSAAQKSPTTAAYVQWQSMNNSLKPIADTADAVFPSLYTYSTDQQAWLNYATALIKEARRYNKPVYVFLWPQYSDTAFDSTLRLAYMPPAFWKLQLETIASLADGIIIWSPSGVANSGTATWDEQAPWWIVTKEFLAAP